MAPRRKLAPVPDVAEEEEQESDIQPYSFEPMTEDLRSRLNVWGNATMMAITQIEKDNPEWARALRDMLSMLKNVAESMSE